MNSDLFQEKQGDLFESLESDGIIVVPHVVNNLGKWSSGFVVPLGKSFPEAESCYRLWSADHQSNSRILGTKEPSNTKEHFHLGNTQFVATESGVVVANMCAQHKTIPDEVRPIRYNSLVACMESVAREIEFYKSFDEISSVEIKAPLFASDRARGNWDFIKLLIQDCWLDKGIKVTIYRID